MKRQSNVFKMLFVLVMLFSFSAIQAQVISVTGTVTDSSDGMPLPGVTVAVKGTTNGTITMPDGTYNIEVESGQVLIYSFIGYTSQETIVTGSPINISLVEETFDMDEVVVIGYGVQRKEDKTGAVAQVTSEELVRGAIQDPVQSIQGKTAGVSVTKTGGDPNAGFSVKIRGASGFDSNTQPLYVIDGVPGVDPTTIAPEDIETFNVLKDAASTAIYGSQGANGVVIISTKKGTKGSSSVNLNMSWSMDNVANRLDMLSASDLRNYYASSGQTSLDGGATTNWQDEIFQTGMTQNYNVNFSGGNETSTYYASLTNTGWDGVMKGTGKDRTIGKINLSHKALDNKLTLSTSLSFTVEKNDYESYDGYDKDDILYQAYSRNPTDPVYNEDGSYYQTDREFNYENPLSVIDNIDNTRDAKRYFGNFKADYEIIKDLKASLNLGYTLDDSESTYFRPMDVYSQPNDGYGRKGYDKTAKTLLEATVNYIKTFGGEHNLNAIAGYSWQETNYNGFYAQAKNPSSPWMGVDNLGGFEQVNFGDVGSYKGMSRLIGYFARAQYNFSHKYYVSASVRTDGSTKFGENNKWGVFPTVAGGWTLTQEEFMSDINWLDNLKLRASYGVSGNQNIGEYRSQILYQTDGLVTNPETGLPVISFRPAWNSNPDLRWESTAEVNIGVDFALFNSRLSGSLEYYQKKTTDLLGAYQVPVPPNLAQTTFANSGELKNSGIELNLQYFVIDNSNFRWKTNFNISHNKQVMLDLGEYAPEDGVRKEGFLSGRGLIGNNNYVTGVIVDEPLGAFYLPEYRGLNDQGKFLYTSTSGGVTSELSSAQRYMAGNPLPDVEFGWSNNMTLYKNWTIDFTFRSMVGNEVYNATKMFFDDPSLLSGLNALPEALQWADQGRTSPPAIADSYVEDASFIRLDYFSLGYNFKPKNDKILKNVKCYLSGNNLFVLTSYSGVDPEASLDGVSFGIDQYNVYPKTRSFSFGISATF
ncbi:SusC/RagA family TonB-linked outer membrane protein [Carboxylicivirga sp. M1479]|uniref:SusC/RagA family TonB-linked outer membrane protein n=1 Tax=Carboxylicivirga sp. M1479 TaxID=2594476 RepID=UPI00117883DE|nr:SusC/RagA family TonB-linked outer membrane protein [Carboxylicivirga sp. M1479]TRX71583.1 SusC/RagA family TonB-linked outer membrane protein [Carboxylicivirga sp. M1479]